MIKIKARIKLFDDSNSRKQPIGNGYRPLFNFIEEMKISGRIKLIDDQKELIFPGEEAMVEISFVSENYFGDNLEIGGKFDFGEGSMHVGSGEVIQLLV